METEVIADDPRETPDRFSDLLKERQKIRFSGKCGEGRNDKSWRTRKLSGEVLSNRC